ncbi:MAG: hypothetical protein B6241_10675 [Spirochaetaceae bacterium 4572_59]|nr:MAG: hypothetical protein B6241_10675 [Spirochaetaceae bacterium 4572_59]
MKLAMIINIYTDVNDECHNPFEHPTSLHRFGEENTLQATAECIRGLETDEEDRLRQYLIGTATQESREFDRQT